MERDLEMGERPGSRVTWPLASCLLARSPLLPALCSTLGFSLCNTPTFSLSRALLTAVPSFCTGALVSSHFMALLLLAGPFLAGALPGP